MNKTQSSPKGVSSHTKKKSENLFNSTTLNFGLLLKLDSITNTEINILIIYIYIYIII